MKKNVFYLLNIALLLTIPVMLVCQEERDVKLTYPAGKQTFAPQSDFNVLYGQLSEPSGENLITCQDAIDFPEYTTQGADDFLVPAGNIWKIHEIYVSGYFDVLGTIPSAIHCYVYKTDPILNVPGDEIFNLQNADFVISSLGNILITLSDPVILDPGTYWVSVQPALPILTGQWFWAKQNSPTIQQEFCWRNPGGGWGIGCTDWTLSSLVPWGVPMEDHNLSFALYGDETLDYLKPGEDAWTVTWSSVSFGSEADYGQIPAGFFGPGSDPFDGVIYFKGKNSDGAQQPAPDVTFERIDTLFLTGLYPQVDNIPTELSQMELVGKDPVAVNFGGEIKYFDVECTWNGAEVACDPGEYTVSDPFGGFFKIGMSFYPLITFTEIGNPANVVVFDPGSSGFSQLSFQSTQNYNWTRSPIPHEFDPKGTEVYVFNTPAGSTLNLVNLRTRRETIVAEFGADGAPISSVSSGFEEGKWYYYPELGWWNTWFYDHPLIWVPKSFGIEIQIIPMPTDQETSSFEMVPFYVTPMWPDYPQMNRPPLPEDIIYHNEEDFIVRPQEYYVQIENLTETVEFNYGGTLCGEYNPPWVGIDVKGKNFKIVVILVHHCFEREAVYFYDWGDAPDYDLAYPATRQEGYFPTCDNIPITGFIKHAYPDTVNVAFFGPAYDVEPVGNGGLCPLFDPNLYDQDENMSDGDAGLIRPSAFTIVGVGAAATVVPILPPPTISLGPPNGVATWGADRNIDIFVINELDSNAYVNLLIDWNQDGYWNFPGTPQEHALVNFIIPPGFSDTLSELNPPPFTIGQNQDYVWTRFSITEVPVAFGWDGAGEFEHGETEDYLLLIADNPDKDFGDAPDDPLNNYPTLLPDGACHGNNPPGIYMGDLIDFELDGQPNPTATGDDLNNLDDGDGVTFLTPLIPGSAASVSVDVSVNNWYLNAWIDFNGDRDWGEADEQIALDAVMTLPSNVINFNVPATATPGRTYARFRYSCETGLQPSGQSICGEVEDYAVYIVQPGTPKMHWPQMPKLGGWDVSFNDCSELADDFLCTESGPISYIRFWVSWKGNLIGNIANLGVTFWSDIPSWENPDGYSKPGTLLWQKAFSPNEFEYIPMDDNLQGWFNPFTNSSNLNDHTKWYQITINNIPEPFIQEMGNIYWMEIDFGCLPNMGWKESDGPQFNDASVYWGGSDWLPINDPITNLPLDLSFIISSTPIFTIDATATPSIICPGWNVQLDVNVSGGSGTYFYSWASLPPPPVFTSNLKNPVVTPAVSTTYIVTVTDGWSFLTDQVTVTLIPPPTVDAGFNATIGVCNTYPLIPLITGTGVTCSWAPPDYLDDPNICNPIFGPAPTGVYVKVITVTDVCGNTATDNVTITVDIAPDANAGPDAVICESDTYLIPAVCTGVGIICSWSPIDYLSDPNICNPVFGPAPPGNYTLTLTVTDIYGCQDQDQVLITVLPEQTIALPFGLSGISSYLIPVIPNPDIAVMFSTVVSDLIILFNSTMNYTPPAAPSPPGVQWNPWLGYQIRMAQANSLTICGPYAIPPIVPLVTGNNLIPILNATNIDIVPGLSSIPQIQVIREIGGPRFWWRSGASSLNVVEPGKAYLVQVSGPCSIDFSLFKGGGSKLKNPEFTNISPWKDVSATLPAHLFAFTPDACKFFENGDIVGIFTPSGLCAGMWYFDEKNGDLGIAAFGDDDFTSETDGFINGQPVQFQMYRPSSEEVFEISVVYSPEFLNTGLYTENGLSLISGIDLTLLGNKELTNTTLRIFPNPGTGLFNISGLNGISNVAVLNSTGSVIFEESIQNSGILNLATQPKGIYIVKINSNNEVIYRKIIIQ